MIDRVNELLSLPSEDVSLRWIITLLHFLWQGAVVGVVVAIAARLLRNSSASVRYVMYLAALVSLPVCVVVTFAIVEVPPTLLGGVPADDAATRTAIDLEKLRPERPGLAEQKLPPVLVSHASQIELSTEVAVASLSEVTGREDKAPAEPGLLKGLSRIAPWIAFCYALVVCGFLLRLGVALRGGDRLRSNAAQLTDSRLLELIEAEARKVGLRLVPAVAWCERVAVPTVVGILRPVVLLPAAIMTGLTSEEFATIISHEFAHIRRYDLWINLLQRVIESLLFFHPVVWFLSRRLSSEREICCDDLVVSSGSEPMNYASALLRMAELCEVSQRPNAVALAVNGTSESLLEHRIIRLINIDRTPRLQLPRASVVAAGWSLMLAAVFLSVAFQSTLNGGGSVGPSTSNQTVDPPANNNPKSNNPALPNVGQAEQQPADNSKVRVMEMKVVDEQGQPISGAKIFANSVTRVPEYRDKRRVDYFTDENGVTNVEIVPTLELLRLWVSKAGYVALFIHWEFGETDSVPTRYNVTLQQGTELGGIVVDPDGKPVRGAKVQVSLNNGGMKIDTNNNSALNGWLAEEADAAETDAQGRWTINNAPAGDNLELNLTVQHPDFLCDTNWARLTSFGLTLESMRSKSGTIKLDRGIAVTGRVVDPQGMPVPEAMIVRGDQPYEESGSQETKTDEQGQFRIPPQKPGPLRLTVVAKNWMPQTKIVDVQNDIAPLEFQMTPGRKLHLKVVDPEGNPFPETYVHLASWRGMESLYNTVHPDLMDSEIPRRGNEGGEYIWNWAPDDAIKVQIKGMKDHRTAAERELELIADNTMQVITLTPVFQLSGTVINAATKEPVSDYVVHNILYSSVMEEAKGNVLSDSINIFQTPDFSVDFDGYPDMIQNAYRFEVPGFRTYRTRRYDIAEPAASLTVELEPMEVQSGRVLNSDGTAAASAKVSIVHPEDLFIISGVKDYRMDRYVDPSGSFLHATQTTNFAVVAATDEGYAEKYCQPGEPAGDLKLKPWSRVEGTLVQDGNPVPDATILLGPIRQLGGDNPGVQDHYRTQTDSEGKFVLSRVPPLPSVVSSSLSSWRDFPITSNQSIPLDLQPGETRSVKLGGDGLQVDGKVRLIGDGADRIEFRYGIHRLVRVDGNPIPVPDHAARVPAFTTGLQRDFERKLAGAEGNVRGREQHSVKLNPDWSMLINGVRPGRYKFLLKVYEPPTGCLVDPIGYGFLEFHTDDYAVNNNRIDLGTIDVALKTIPQVGDQLSNFSWQDLNGRKGSLSDYQAQFVLLDFWATWCGPCIQAMPEIRKLHEASLLHPNLRVLSLSIDEDAEKAKAFVREKKFEWSQGFLGDITASSTGDALGISSVPLYILLDRDGKIVARSTSLQDKLLHGKILEAAKKTVK